MKRIVYFIAGILVLSGFSVLGMSGASENQQTLSISFAEPLLSETDGFVQIHVDGTTTQLEEPNRPLLPVYVKTYQIPFRSTDIQVTCTPHEIRTMSLPKEIIPARVIRLSEDSSQVPYVKDPAIYGSATYYPDTWYSSDLGAGRNEQNVQVTFVKVVCYPVRYSPVHNQLLYTDGFDIQVTYHEPTTPVKTAAEAYDLLIIAPEKFASALQPLVDHKNSKGMKTVFKSVESILDAYEGYDPPEQIKYCIEHEYNQSNITYVLLVGGLKSHIYAKDKDTASAGWTAWWVPVRYANTPSYSEHGDDEAVLCDLYYGCLYNATGAFDSWNSNGDGYYAAWGLTGAPRDMFDMNAEVYVSRIPCVTTSEVKAAVKKIITYESSGPGDKSWYTNFIGVGGKTFYNYSGKPDGEYLCDLTYNYTKNAIPSLQLTRCYTTNRDTGGRTPIPRYIIKSLNEGAGFVNFQGHGNTYLWDTIWFDGVYPDDWAGGFNVFFFPLLSNGDKLPVVIVGGCHNGLYNVSIIGALKDRFRSDDHDINYFCYIPSPVCYSAGLVTKARGGAIAATGCAGYGLGSGGGDPAGSRSSALETNFFYEVGNGSTHLAQAHSLAIMKYNSEHTVGSVDAFCINEWALFGDASLLFGGYSS